MLSGPAEQFIEEGDYVQYVGVSYSKSNGGETRLMGLELITLYNEQFATTYPDNLLAATNTDIFNFDQESRWMGVITHQDPDGWSYKAQLIKATCELTDTGATSWKQTVDENDSDVTVR